MEQTMTQIRAYFRLETSCLRLEQEEKQAELAIRKAKYDLREAQQERLLYSGSFRAFRDKLAGRREEVELTLHRAVNQAETSVTTARQEKERLAGELSDIRNQLIQLPSPAELKAKAEGETFTEFIRLDSLLAVEKLEPLLEENLESLEELRKIRRGERVGELKYRAEWSVLDTMPEKQTREFMPLLSKLEENLPHLGMSLSLGEYFREPTVFLNPAAKHNQLDRVSQAIGQMEQARKEIRNIRKKLEELQ